MPAGTPRLSMFKSVSRYMTEPHPFARNPVTVKPAPIAWNALARHMGRTGKSVVPFFALVLGWPVMMAKVLDKTIGM